MKRVAAALLLTVVFFSGARAMTITESTSSAVIPPRLVVPGTGITVTGITGTYTNVTYASGMGYYTDGPLGIADGIIISNGYASSALPPSDYGSTSGILGLPGNPLVNTILGYSATSYDAVSFRITFDVDPGINSVMFDFIFGSEEFPEYVGASVNDAFGVFLNGVQIVHDEYGQPLTINAAYFSVVEPATGLEYDGSTAKLNTAAAVTPGSTGNVIEFVIADVADSIYDSGALLARLRGSPMSVTTPVTVPDTPTVTPTHTDSPTYTHTATATPTYTQTPTFTFTLTHTLTHTMTPTPTYTATPTFTCTYTATPTFTFTLTATPTVTVTHTPTITPTATATVTMTPTPPPLVLDLKGNFPNPFIKETQIVFWLSRQAACKIKVFTVSGEVVREEQGINGLAGYNAWYWDGKNRAVKPVASGIFIYRVEAFTETGEHAEAYAKAAAAK